MAEHAPSVTLAKMATPRGYGARAFCNIDQTLFHRIDSDSVVGPCRGLPRSERRTPHNHRNLKLAPPTAFAGSLDESSPPGGRELAFSSVTCVHARRAVSGRFQDCAIQPRRDATYDIDFLGLCGNRRHRCGRRSLVHDDSSAGASGHSRCRSTAVYRAYGAQGSARTIPRTDQKRISLTTTLCLRPCISAACKAASLRSFSC